VILSLGLIALSQLYLAGMYTYKKARFMSVATQRAQQELERVHDLKYNGLAYGTLIDATRFPPDEYTALFFRRGVRFTVDELPQGYGTIVIAKYNGYTHLLKVTISVKWGGMEQTRSDVVISTLIAN